MTATITTSYRFGIVAGSGITSNGPVVPAITTDDIFNPDAPTQTLTDMLAGISSAKLVGSAIMDTTATGDFSLFTVPTGKIMIPTEIIFALTAISGSGTAPAINLGYQGSLNDYIDAGLSTNYAAASAIPFAAGTAYSPGDTLTLTGGTHSSAATLTVATLKLVSATIAAGGTGYGNAQTFNVTVAGGTTSQAATVNVTSNSSGVITTINSVTVPGSYTVLPTLSGNAVTGGSGSGLTLNLVFGVKTVTVDDAGAYTAIPSNHVAVTGGAGTGATFDLTWSITGSLFDSLTTVGELMTISDIKTNTDSNIVTYQPAGTTLKARVEVAATYDDFKMICFVFGFLTTTPAS